MSVSLRADSGGATGALALNGSDKLVLNADGTLSATANPATGLRSQALATMQKFADEFGSLMNAAGYQKLPSGLIIQWGTTTPTSGGAVTTFPIVFPTSTKCIMLVAASSVNVYAAPGGSPLVSFTAFSASTSPGTYWMAIGN